MTKQIITLLAILALGCSDELESCEDGSESVCRDGAISYCIAGKLQPMIDCGAFEAAAHNVAHGCFEYESGAMCEPVSTPVDFYDDPEISRGVSDSDLDSVLSGLENAYDVPVKLISGHSESTRNTVKLLHKDNAQTIWKAAHEFEHQRQADEFHFYGTFNRKYDDSKRYRFSCEVKANITELSAWYAVTGNLDSWKVARQVKDMRYKQYGFTNEQIAISKRIYSDAAEILRSGGMTSSFSPVTDLIVDKLLDIGYLVD